MQRRPLLALAAFSPLGTLLVTPAIAAPGLGQAAPDFTLTDTAGKPVKLSDFKGKTVVLEWNNPGCPFVRKHYQGNMQALQKDFTQRGVVWLAINDGSGPRLMGLQHANAARPLLQDVQISFPAAASSRPYAGCRARRAVAARWKAKHLMVARASSCAQLQEGRNLSQYQPVPGHSQGDSRRAARGDHGAQEVVAAPMGERSS